MLQKIKSLVSKDGAAAIMLAIVLLVVLSIGSPYFFSVTNLNSLQTSIAPNTIVAIGMMLLLILGVFDLSVGSIMCLVGIFISDFLNAGLSIPLTILLGILIGAVCGLINGILVGAIGINQLIATIGTQYAFLGLAYFKMSNIYQSTSNFPQAFINIGSGKFLGLYYQFWFMLILLAVLTLFLKHTHNGRVMYYIGGNRAASASMGFSSKKALILAYTVTGILAAIAAIFSVARYQNANRYLGDGIEMTAIIGCIIGGCALSGGKGGTLGVLCGVAFMSLVTNLFNLFEVSSTWQEVVVGAILVITIAVDGYINVKKLREQGKI